MRSSQERCRCSSDDTRDRYVKKVSENDVQLGRGRPLTTSEGNVRFRSLVLGNKAEYTSSNRHAHKAEIALRILRTIGERGGRFLRKLDAAAEKQLVGVPDGEEAWVIVDEETSLEKVKQALREQAPPPARGEEAASKEKSSPRRKRKSSSMGAMPKDAAVQSDASNRLKISAVKAQPNHPAMETSIAPEALLVEPSLKAARASEMPEARSERSMNHDLSYSLKHPSLRKRDMLRLRRQQQAAMQIGGRTLEANSIVEVLGRPQSSLELQSATSTGQLNQATVETQQIASIAVDSS